MAVSRLYQGAREHARMLTGRILGGYEILEELGRGAMGVVFKARQLSMDRVVALKFLPKRMAQDEKVVQRFLREARAAGQLSHPNIVGVHDVGMIEGLHYIAMEFVDGQPVQKHVKEKGHLTEIETLEIAEQIAEALKLAHSRGILHRDVKPDNFLIDTEGRVRLSDLGLARFQNKERNSAEITQDGTTMGTPHYMSPEQCSGERIDARSDLYSLGVSMYVMASGKTPYEGTTAAAVMVKVLTESPIPLRKAKPDLSSGFHALVEKMMAKEPSRRFHESSHVLEAIRLCKTGSYRPVTSPHAKVGQTSKLKLWLAGAGLGVASLITLGILANLGKKKPDAPVTEPVAIVEPETTKVNETADKKRDSKGPQNPKSQPQPKPAPPANLKPENEHENDPDATTPQKERYKTLRQEVQELRQRNPAEAAKQIREFLAQNPALNRPGPGRRPFRERVMKLLEDVTEDQKRLEKDWAEIEREAKAAIEKQKGPDAFQSLHTFKQMHAGSDEALKARAMMEGIKTDAMSQAKELAKDKWRLEPAKRYLAYVVDKLPNDEDGELAKYLKFVQAEDEKAELLVSADQRQLAAFNPKARALAQAAKPGEFRCYQFADAAEVYRQGLPLLATPQGKGDAECMAEVYGKAAEVLTRMRAAVNGGMHLDLDALGKFKEHGRLEGWDDETLTYTVAGIGPQNVPLRDINAEHLVGLAKQLKIASGTAVGDMFDIGALAFAAGADEIAAEKLNEAAAIDSEIKRKVAPALRLLKPAVPENAEAQAEQILKDAKVAAEKHDAEAVAGAVKRLTSDFGETEFVKSHAKEIQALAAGKEPEKEKDKEKEKEKDTKEELAAAAELKKLGWTDVKGEWAIDPKVKTAFVTTNGRLSVPLKDGGVSLSFQLEEKATIGLYVRHDDLLGYGFFANETTGSIIASRQRTPTRLPNEFKLTAAPHTLQVLVRSNRLEVTLDGKPFTYTDDLRDNGEIRVLIDGQARVDRPTVIK